MLVDKLKKLLSKDYKIIGDINDIEIYHISYGNIEQEVYVKCKKSVEGWTVYKVIRDNNYEIGSFIDEDYITCLIYIICIRNFEGIKENNILKRKLRTSVGENEVENAIEIIKSECDLKYFSLDNEKKDAICMECVNELYNVFYSSIEGNKVSILSNLTYNRTLTVVYSYSILLKEFNRVYENLLEQYPMCERYYNKLLRYYLNK